MQTNEHFVAITNITSKIITPVLPLSVLLLINVLKSKRSVTLPTHDEYNLFCKMPVKPFNLTFKFIIHLQYNPCFENFIYSHCGSKKLIWAHLKSMSTLGRIISAVNTVTL